jgi:leucyl-tRNA synthetase
MKEQLQLLGLSIDWDLEISTCDEEYYKHQQELFIDFFKKGLVIRKETYVNWDPIDKTVLAMNKLLTEGAGDQMQLLKEKNYRNGFLIFQNFLMSY